MTQFFPGESTIISSQELHDLRLKVTEMTARGDRLEVENAGWKRENESIMARVNQERVARQDVGSAGGFVYASGGGQGGNGGYDQNYGLRRTIAAHESTIVNRDNQIANLQGALKDATVRANDLETMVRSIQSKAYDHSTAYVNYTRDKNLRLEAECSRLSDALGEMTIKRDFDYRQSVKYSQQLSESCTKRNNLEATLRERDNQIRNLQEKLARLRMDAGYPEMWLAKQLDSYHGLTLPVGGYCMENNVGGTYQIKRTKP